MKRILFTIVLCLIVCASCRHTFYDREGVVTKVKIEHSSYKDVTYSYKVIVEDIDKTELSGKFILYTNVKYQVGDTVSIGNANTNTVVVHDTVFYRMSD